MTFQDIVYEYFKKNKRSYPWRETTDPYKILVSEIMLQQTQTERVVPKYLTFIKRFPNVESLAKGTTAEILRLWQGLGYNRRALYLKKCAEVIFAEHRQKFPKKEEELQKLPGIGPYTAAAITVFSYNKPAIVIETNIRTVYIHHFFPNSDNISDKELIPLINKTMDTKNPRKWFNALMDYGAFLKKEIGNVSRKSKAYTKQPRFKGSIRELRGKILTRLSKGDASESELLMMDSRAKKIIAILSKEKFISKKKEKYILRS